MATSPGAGHEYTTRLTWTGNLGEGTSAYDRYGRGYRVSVEGKPDLAGSADRAFLGEPDRHNPEDLFVTAVSACHMLFFLSLCARRGVQVTAYMDEARGSIVVDSAGGGRFAGITLRPSVTVSREQDVDAARRLHATAHELCFIARSCSAPIHVEPVVRPADPMGTEFHRTPVTGGSR